MRVLVVEDDAKTARSLSRGLREAGFLVDVVVSAQEGLAYALEGGYDLLLLDVMLPDREGWWVLEELRRSGAKVPVICLTARDAVSDRVRGLELGADDCVAKPFAFAELLARVRAVLRRGPELFPEVYRVGDLEVDVRACRARRAGQELALTPKEFALLALLARRPEQVFTRRMIAAKVWDTTGEVDANVVDVAIHRLREKVDKPFATPLIHTVRGVGYVLKAPQS